ncbi:MAG TPA: hypothetical protein VGR62_19635 [Candidatus Binatia bacterium]|nr:hypothetical protein [Candidatus Binatia bacterium]
MGQPLGVPWPFIGVVHSMEASLRFTTHLHNGDSLKARTVQVPKGYPKGGAPPFTWEFSATDALRLKRLDAWSEWTLAGMLYKLEEYNGFGYRQYHPDVLSPYLWGFSNHHTAGKYVADGTWSSTAKTKQCGAAVLLRRMAENGTIRFDADGKVAAGGASPTVGTVVPLIRYSTTRESALAAQLQALLNVFPGVFVQVDGIPGKRTSDAVRQVTGQYLAGDPRA